MLKAGWIKSSFSFSNGNCVEARWRKSSYSYSNGHCAEVAFRKSSYSGPNGCTEAALADGVVLVRDSKLGEASPLLKVSPAAWTVFLASVKDAPVRYRNRREVRRCNGGSLDGNG